MRVAIHRIDKEKPCDFNFRSIIVVALPLLLVACTSGKGAIRVLNQNKESTVVYTTGSIVSVIEGVAPDPDKWIRLSNFRAGFEAGSPHGIESIGEFIAFNGIGYSKSTKLGSGYYQIASGPEIVSNGAIFLPQEAIPAMRLEVNAPTTLDQLYEEMHHRIQGPLCFVGTAVFQRYYATALAKAPIRGENIFDHRDEYYGQPAVDEPHVPAGLMGCVSRLESIHDPEILEGLGAVLYNNPFDPVKGLTTHTHSLRLTKAVRNVQEIVPANAVDVHHIFQDSMLEKGEFELYRIRSFARAATFDRSR